MDHSSHSMGGGSDMSDSMPMVMVFQTENATPLYTSQWTPKSPATYAATCIFLIGLSIAARLLLTLRHSLEAKWLARDSKRRYVCVSGKQPLAEQLAADAEAKQMRMTLSENGTEENVLVVTNSHTTTRPWRLSVEPVRAVLDTSIVGVGYLLMLAVMTMNVGYFLSVLAGVFIGSLAVGRYCGVAEH